MGFNSAASLTRTHERALEIRRDLVSPWSEEFDSFRDGLLDEGADLNSLLILLLKGEGPEAVALTNRLAMSYAMKEAGK